MTTAPVILAEISRGAALKAMRRAFAAAGIETPDLDARMLLCGVLDIDAVRLITEADIAVGSGAAALAAATRRRVAREPVSRILGWREFYGRRFDVTPATLDPRPDSETVIDAVLAFVRGNGGIDRPWRILDMGTGTGCLAITLLAELPTATGVATDISRDALQVAAVNAQRIGVASRLAMVSADGIEPLANAGEVFDILVSNPPYIPSDAIAGLAPEVRQFDPRLALDGGGDGLDHYRRLVERASSVVPSGFICFEVGHDQGEAVAGLLREFRDGQPGLVRDLSGHIRCVTQTTQR